MPSYVPGGNLGRTGLELRLGVCSGAVGVPQVTCMASGPLAGSENGARQIQRYSEDKVYKRKSFKGPKKDAASNTTATAAAKDSPVSNPSKGNENNVDDANNRCNSREVATRIAASDGTDSPQPPIPQPQVANFILLPPNCQPEEVNLRQQLPISQDEDANLVHQSSQSLPDGANWTQQPQVSQIEEANSALQLSIPQPEAAPDNCSLNQQQATVPIVREPPLGNGLVEPTGLDGKVRINLTSRSKEEVWELRKRLQGELDTIRIWVRRIEAKEGQFFGSNDSRMVEIGTVDIGAPRDQLEAVPISVPPLENRPFNKLSVSVLENSQGITESIEKEKRTPKANQFYRNSDFLLAKDKFPPAESNKKSKVNGKKKGGDSRGWFSMGPKFFKSCITLLEKLMRHQFGWVFNHPVDVEGLGLRDYYSIIKHPMDLGTVKTKLNANIYRNLREFAEDVRLTFHNAMTYNPEGQDVHFMAATLLKIFEDRWAIIESDYYREIVAGFDYGMGLPTPISRNDPLILPSPLDVRRVLDRSESMTFPSDLRPRPVSITPSGRTPAPKKPKAKDPHKREMTFDEKQKLSTNLQNLPSDKLDNIVQIIRKRNSALRQHDDEIEVDIDSVDTETLWELDRFVMNYKKSLSKNKRKAELAMQARLQVQQNTHDEDMVPPVTEEPKETETGQKIASSSPPVQVEKQGTNSSRSSSSNSSSSDSGSSSSDSDSDSSSSSDSDPEHSPRT